MFDDFDWMGMGFFLIVVVLILMFTLAEVSDQRNHNDMFTKCLERAEQVEKCQWIIDQ